METLEKFKGGGRFMINKLETDDVLLVSEEGTALLIQITKVNNEGFTYKRIYYGQHQPPKATSLSGYPKLFNIDGFNFYDYQLIKDITKAKANNKDTTNQIVTPEGEKEATWGKTAGLEYVELEDDEVYFDYRRLNYQEKVGIITEQL